ncbi:hypothetical protein L6452_02035 [Arctium lappa]|uniref:Uncharacterized protein n=1 Tax=Arctium lappa TaxID=4217 RepID=A0ACB9FII3_ARCLA|nr:hypothetical protein L6452_02035 [Arctium lappa]
MVEPTWSTNQNARYLFCCSYSHNVAPKGKYITFVIIEAETDIPEQELKLGIDLLGPVDQIFFDIYDRYEPTNKGAEDHCFISTVVEDGEQTTLCHPHRISASPPLMHNPDLWWVTGIKRKGFRRNGGDGRR